MSQLSGAETAAAIRVAAAERVLRAGGVCEIGDGAGRCRVKALDGLDPDQLAARLSAGCAIVLTATRAHSLGLVVPAGSCARLRFTSPPGRAVAQLLVDPTPVVRALASEAGLTLAHASTGERAAVALAKRAGLLPVVLVDEAGNEPAIAVEAAAIMAQQRADVTALVPVIEVPVPIAAAEQARLVVFRAPAIGVEHLAIVVGAPERLATPLVRLHSECLTGDVFGSLRCDCGEQLDGALRLMSAEGGGVLLYLRQEGRGIGLVNKLRAYRLQDQGLDTVDANTHLGFEPDERDFAIAARMLDCLGIGAIRLLTNNPDKVTALAQHGIEIAERLPLTFAANRHNRFYLETKARRSGHLLRLVGGASVGPLGPLPRRHADVSGG